MINSKFLNFLYEKWLMLVAWYDASLSSKVLKKIYGSISDTWTHSYSVRSFCSGSDKWRNSLVYKLFYLPFSFLSLFASDFFVGISNKIKKTSLYKVIYCIVNNLIAVSTRFTGVFFACGLGVYMLASRDFSNPVFIGAFVVALLMCMFDFSLLHALSHSIVKVLLKLFLSVEPTFDYYDETQLEKKGRLVIAGVCGIILGFVAAYISPIVAIGFIGVLLVMFNVEFGIGITVFAIPFLPTMLCAGLAILCFFALFVQKCSRGDKEWKLDIIGFALLLFIIVVAICSFTSVAPEHSLTVCFLCIALISFYFTIVNTIKTRNQIYSLLVVFIVAALLVSVYGIIQYVFGLDMDKQVWVDEEMFTDIKMRAFSTLENPNVLGEYLLITIPVAVAFMWSEKKFLSKLTYAVICAVMLLCLVLTMSRGCWIGILVTAAMFITFVDGRYWSLGIVALLLMPSLLPASVLNRFLSIGNLGDSSSSYRLFIWLGSISMLKDFWLVGIGPGIQAFNLIYPRYAYPTIIAPHAHNVYLQQMIETGVVGLGTLIYIIFAFFRRMAKSAHSLSKKNADRVMIIAISAGVVGFLVQGVFDYVFYNYRMYMMFWMYLAFGSCIANLLEDKKEANT